MNQPTHTSEKMKEKVQLILSTNYFSSILMICLAPLCYFLLDIKEIIPQTFIIYGVLNIINTFFFYRHRKLIYTYLITSCIGIICAAIVTLYSGGVNSPFTFVLALIVFAGYISTKNYGRFHLYLILLFILFIYFHDSLDFNFQNKVPEYSRDSLSLIGILFSVYILGGIFGKILLTNYNNLYISKREIEKKSKENEILLKEIHHRVKNNLQTISSLLNIQARNTNNDETKRILTNSHNRVLSMAIVHEMLYAREDLSRIEYKEYVTQLGKFLIESLNKEDKKIELNIAISNIKFNIETSIPLGLLISEFITNSIKHAFLNKNSGKIGINIEKVDPEFFQLTLTDNGIGYNKELLCENPNSMGFKLIANLSRQLRGTINKTTSEGNGVIYVLKFKEI
ncbi:MAG: sensor histidine kinase [Galbibacter orientalis]|uniref:sensor histidine kinase n=1 Tax=Galbibacter orientalis TaxID=453852 RepID=UPI00300211DA